MALLRISIQKWDRKLCRNSVAQISIMFLHGQTARLSFPSGSEVFIKTLCCMKPLLRDGG